MDEHPKSFLDSAEEGIKNSWHWILALVILFLLFEYGWIYSFVRGILSLAAVIYLGKLAWIMWVHYIQQDFISGIKYVLLEITPPREVLRSPQAMELFISNALYHFSYKGGKEEYWQGAVWFWFSLEIASIGGIVHFYVRTPSRIQGLIETQMYAQYPQSQVKLVEDYTLAIDEITPESKWNAWGCEFNLLKPEAYSIRTYIDYGLDKDPDEEYKVDPISPVIELFGSIAKDEQMWVQFVVTPSRKMYHTKGTMFGKHDWVEQSREETKKLLDPYTRIFRPESPGGKPTKGVYMPSYLQPTVERMSKKRDKLGFETGVRIMYVTTKERMPPGTRTNNSRDIRLIFRSYQNPSVNGFNRTNATQGDRYGGLFPSSKETVMMLANRMLHEYRERAFFHLPLRHHLFSQHIWDWPIPGALTLSSIIKAYVHHETFVLNAEELATIWHFPGQIMRVPTLERIESKEASPPTNLPT